jgi:multidrug efflux system outer membrane protein
MPLMPRTSGPSARGSSARRPQAPYAISLGLLLVVAGCAGPSPREDADPSSIAASVGVPEAWSAAAGAKDGGSSPTADASWWSAFGDSRLSALILEALDHNPDLAGASARVAAASASLDAAAAFRWPEVSLTTNAERRRQNFIGIPIPGSGGVLSSTTTGLGASLTAGWELDLWGRISAGERVAAGGLAASMAEEQGLRLSLGGQVAIAWFHLVESRSQVALATTIVDRWRLAEERIAARVEEGILSSLDLRLTRTERAAAEAERATLERRASAARRALELLLGRYPSESVEGTEALPGLPPLPEVPLPARVLARRPDLVAARARLAAAGAEVERSEADLYPRITLNGTGGGRSEELSDLLDGDFSVWSLGAGLVAPLLDGGRRRAVLGAAEARRREAEAGFARALLSACGEVESALSDEAHLRETSERLAVLLEESARARDLAQARFSAGLTDILTFLAAERSVARAEARSIEIERARLENRVRLVVALGGSGAAGLPGTGSSVPEEETRP